MNIKCLPRIRGVPTSFYKLNMMFSTNQGTPQDYSSLHQIKAVAHMRKLRINDWLQVGQAKTSRNASATQAFQKYRLKLKAPARKRKGAVWIHMCFFFVVKSDGIVETVLVFVSFLSGVV